MLTTRVYVIHGYTASSQQNWFPWIAEQLANRDIACTVFDMPDPNEPDVNKWDKWLDTHIKQCDEHTVLIGHSLGCIALLRYLNRQAAPGSVGGIILVSGFLEPVSTLPMLDPFTTEQPDYTKIIRMARQRVAISSPNDTIVAYEHTRRLAQRLNAELLTIENGGHFLDREGFIEFPELLTQVCKMIEQ